MILAARIIAGIVGLLHIWIFVMESILWMRPAIFKRFGVRTREEAETLKTAFLNQGFYNLFLATGALLGAILFEMKPGFAPPIMVFACASIVGAGLVLLFSGGKKLMRAAIIQGLPPLIAIILLIAANG